MKREKEVHRIIWNPAAWKLRVRAFKILVLDALAFEPEVRDQISYPLYLPFTGVL